MKAIFNRTHFLGWLSLLALLLASCSSDSTDKAQKFEGAETTTDRGPAKVTVRLDKPEATIADKLSLEIEITADPGHSVEFPGFDDKIGEFGILSRSKTQPELIDGDRTREIHRYTLEPFLSGDYSIPPIKLSFQKEGEDATYEIETDEIPVKIASLLAEDVANIEIHDITGPVELPGKGLSYWLGFLAAIILVWVPIGAFVWWLWKRRTIKVEESEPPLLPHQLALSQLDALIAEELPKKGMTKEFYQRISDILRRYIENRFGVHAPGQTTEEFLVEHRESSFLSTAHRYLLSEFLQHCDLVKFAEHQPDEEELEKTITTCRGFINETQMAQSEPEVAG